MEGCRCTGTGELWEAHLKSAYIVPADCYARHLSKQHQAIFVRWKRLKREVRHLAPPAWGAHELRRLTLSQQKPSARQPYLDKNLLLRAIQSLEREYGKEARARGESLAPLSPKPSPRSPRLIETVQETWSAVKGALSPCSSPSSSPRRQRREEPKEREK